MIRGKYGEDRGGWRTREVREAHGVGLWKAIRMDWDGGCSDFFQCWQWEDGEILEG